jgi:hypothetical protein
MRFVFAYYFSLCRSFDELGRTLVIMFSRIKSNKSKISGGVAVPVPHGAAFFALEQLVYFGAKLSLDLNHAIFQAT